MSLFILLLTSQHKTRSIEKAYLKWYAFSLRHIMHYLPPYQRDKSKIKTFKNGIYFAFKHSVVFPLGFYETIKGDLTGRFKILALILFLAIWGAFFYFGSVFFTNENLYHYFFSTIIQGFLALLGFLGAMTLFKLHFIETDSRETSDKIVQKLKPYGVSIGWVDYPTNVSYQCEKLFGKDYESSPSLEIKGHLLMLRELLGRSKSFTDKFIGFLFLVLFDIVVSIAFFPAIPVFVNIAWLGGLSLLFVTILSLASLRSVWGLVRLMFFVYGRTY